jgi:hypothetical protein
MTFWRTAAMALLACLPGLAQDVPDWPDSGPPETQDLFPLNLLPLAYRPASAVPLGKGEARVSLQATRSNTFEFSDPIKSLLEDNASTRHTVTREVAEDLARTLPQDPLLFYFDGEIQRTEVHMAWGLGRNVEAGLTLGALSMDGGVLDGLIEAVHRLGFEQTGRSAINRDQLTLLVIQRGRVVAFRQNAIRLQSVDPELSILWRCLEAKGWSLALTGTIQLPVTQFGGILKPTWDTSVGAAFQAPRLGGWRLEGGVAYLRRRVDGAEGQWPFIMKDQMAGHVCFEWEGGRRVRPYLLLLYQNGLLVHSPSMGLGHPSLNHDLGVHIRMGRRTILTLGYINNITHNENTADMGLEARISVRY